MGACDVASCEVVSMVKACKTSLEPIHFCVPRKSELFQDDIFPDTPGPDPAMSSSEWLGGANKNPIKFSLEGGFVAKAKPEFKPIAVKEVKEEKKRLYLNTKLKLLTLTKESHTLRLKLSRKTQVLRNEKDKHPQVYTLN